MTFIGLMLISCVSTATTWEQHGVTPEQFAVDKETCRSLARGEVEDAYKNNSNRSAVAGIINEDFYQ